MPVQDGDRVLAINILEDITEPILIEQAALDAVPFVRPIIADDFFGPMTYQTLRELGGLQDGDAIYFDEFPTGLLEALTRVPYMVEGPDGTIVYQATTVFDPSQNYILLSTRQEESTGVRTQSAGRSNQAQGGSGGRGGGGGQGQTGSDGERDSDGESEGEGEGEGEDPNSQIQGPPGMEGANQGQGQGSGSGSGQGQGQGQGQGEGEGEGEGEGSGQGQPSGAGGNTSGQGSGSGQGQGQGQGEGSGQGQPSGAGGNTAGDSGGEPGAGEQPGPMESGEATGGPETGDGPPNLEEILEQLEQEQSMREQEQSGGEPSDSGEGEPSDSGEESGQAGQPMPSDNGEGEPSDSGESGEGEPSDTGDVPPTQPSDSGEPTPSDGDGEDRPWEDLSDEELQRLIDEIKRRMNPPQPQPQPGPEPGPPNPDMPPQPGPNPFPTGEPPVPSPNNDPTLDRPQNWQWLNLGSGSYGISPTSLGSEWTHMLWIEGMVGRQVLTFGGIMDVMTENGINFEAFRPTPAEAYLEFPDFQSYSAATAIASEICDYYLTFELDDATNTIIFSYTDDTTFGPENRWVPENMTENLSDESGDAARQEIQDIIDQMRQDSDLAQERGIPQSYGESSTNEYVEQQGVESNADRQQQAQDAGATAGASQAAQDAQDRSNNTQSARQEAQSASNAAERASMSDDASAAAEAAVRATEAAQRANANADPESATDRAAVDTARQAAQDAISTAAEMNPELQPILEEVSQDLDNMELGTGMSDAQIAAQEAVEASQQSQQSSELGDLNDAIMSARESIRAAQEARESAVEGDITDRQAVDLAKLAAQDAIRAAAEAGWEDAEAWEQLLNQIPDFPDMSEAAEEAEARKRDTMPGEFADVGNEAVGEDMLRVAEEAVRNAERALAEANPAFEPDAAAVDYILQETEQTISNAANWGADAESLNELQDELNQAIEEYSNREYSMSAVWQGDSDCWYRDRTGKILVFADSESALIWAVQNRLVTDNRVIARLPEDWESRLVEPIARREN